jgi:hypothetical protein
MATGTITDEINKRSRSGHRSMQLRDTIGNQGRLSRAAGGSECSIDGCHCHHCDAVVGTNQIAIRKKRASLGQEHHRRLVSDRNVSDKEARAAANCMVLHPACHDDPVDFYRLHGFFRTISEGSRDANSRAAGESRLRFITLATILASLGLAVFGWEGVASFFSHPALIAP